MMPKTKLIPSFSKSKDGYIEKVKTSLLRGTNQVVLEYMPRIHKNVQKWRIYGRYFVQDHQLLLRIAKNKELMWALRQITGNNTTQIYRLLNLYGKKLIPLLNIRIQKLNKAVKHNKSTHIILDPLLNPLFLEFVNTQVSNLQSVIATQIENEQHTNQVLENITHEDLIRNLATDEQFKKIVGENTTPYHPYTLLHLRTEATTEEIVANSLALLAEAAPSSTHEKPNHKFNERAAAVTAIAVALEEGIKPGVELVSYLSKRIKYAHTLCK